MDVINGALLIPSKYKRYREDDVDDIIECKCVINVIHISNCETMFLLILTIKCSVLVVKK